ncbi:AraC family transcriptional regulator [Streptomyces sp. NPDC026206]|uniref:helix-turn-helix domain-containing protein n=1 Tax=Streptomyces sp. NPDC026206 TaxID=3157089 RepID=UPI0033FD9C4B
MYHTWMRYFTPGPVHHRLGLVCLGVGLQHGTLPAVGPRTLDHHVAVVISAGTGWYRTPDARTHAVTAPALLWLTPGVPHHYGAARGTGWDESFVDFTGAAVAAYTELGYIEPERPLVPLTDTTGPRTAVTRIARAARRGNPLLEVETSAAVHELLVALRQARAAPTGDTDPVLRALARDAFLHLSVTQHAARHGMTPAELRSAVRRGAGCSPKDYLLGIRLGRAKELLAATELPVAAVARRVGYDDPAYFSRLFTRRVGTAPIRFRAHQGRAVPGGWSNEIPDPEHPPVTGSRPSA